jgi:hypothetical protein
VSLKLQAGARPDTFAAEIVEPTASRVLARSAFGSDHDPDPDAVTGVAEFVAATLVLRPQPEVVLAPPHAPTSKPAPTSTTTLRMAPRLLLILIWLIS